MMAFQILCALAAGWLVEATFKPEASGRHIGRILRAIRKEISL